MSRNPRPCAVCGRPASVPASPPHFYVPAKRTEPLRAWRLPRDKPAAPLAVFREWIEGGRHYAILGYADERCACGASSTLACVCGDVFDRF